MRKLALLLLCLTVICISCKKYRCPETVYCSEGYNFVLVGFDTSELDTVILRVYKAGSSFTSLVDTGVVIDTVVNYSTNGLFHSWSGLFGNYHDSLLNESMVLAAYRVSIVDTAYVPYDWELYIPKDNRTFRITGINFTGSRQQTVESCDQKGNKFNGSCSLSLSSYAIDGIVCDHSSFNNKYDARFIFLNK